MDYTDEKSGTTVTSKKVGDETGEYFNKNKVLFDKIAVILDIYLNISQFLF